MHLNHAVIGISFSIHNSYICCFLQYCYFQIRLNTYSAIELVITLSHATFGFLETNAFESSAWINALFHKNSKVVCEIN